MTHAPARTLAHFGRASEAASPASWPIAAPGEGPGACASCWRPLTAGAALRVIPTDGGRPYAIHRPGESYHCFPAASRRCHAAIELYDPAAAREYDRAAGGPTVDQPGRALADALAIHATKRS